MDSPEDSDTTVIDTNSLKSPFNDTEYWICIIQRGSWEINVYNNYNLIAIHHIAGK